MKLETSKDMLLACPPQGKYSQSFLIWDRRGGTADPPRNVTLPLLLDLQPDSSNSGPQCDPGVNTTRTTRILRLCQLMCRFAFCFDKISALLPGYTIGTKDSLYLWSRPLTCQFILTETQGICMRVDPKSVGSGWKEYGFGPGWMYS